MCRVAPAPEKGTCNGDSLFLSPTQLEAPLTHHGVEAIREAPDSISEAGHVSCLNDLLPAGCRLAIRNVAEQGIIEEDSVLGHYCYCSP